MAYARKSATMKPVPSISEIVTTKPSLKDIAHPNVLTAKSVTAFVSPDAMMSVVIGMEAIVPPDSNTAAQYANGHSLATLSAIMSATHHPAALMEVTAV